MMQKVIVTVNDQTMDSSNWNCSGSGVLRSWSTCSGRALLYLGFTFREDEIIGSDDTRSLFIKSSFVFFLEHFLVKCSQYFLKSLLRDSSASSLIIPIGSTMCSITRYP